MVGVVHQLGWLVGLSDDLKLLLYDVRAQILDALQDEQQDTEVLYWFGGIDYSSVYNLYEKRRVILGYKRNKLILIFDSSGGDADAAYQLVELLRSYCDNLEIVIPVWAKSAGTLVCLAAKKIYMTGIAELGPLDTQIMEPGEVRLKGALDEYQATMRIREEAFNTLDHAVALILNKSGGMNIPDTLALSGKFVSDLLEPLYYQIDPILLGKRARQLDVGFQYAIRILTTNDAYNEQQVKYLADRLVYRYPSHSFVINYNEAAYFLGLPVCFLEPDGPLDILINQLLSKRGEDLELIGSFVGEESELQVSEDADTGDTALFGEQNSDCERGDVISVDDAIENSCTTTNEHESEAAAGIEQEE